MTVSITIIINEFAVLIVEASYIDVVCDLGECWTAQQFLSCGDSSSESSH